MTPRDRRTATAQLRALADYTGLAQRLDPAAVALVDAALAHAAAKQAAGDRADEMVAAIEKHASPDGGPVRIEAEYLLALAHS